ncbi:MAG: aminotransferase class III-fold pyridoxal phosphate-dependent enzyme [Anaerolineae bacterium]
MSRNLEQWRRASSYLPGGICASARIHKGLDSPFYIRRGEGGKVYDLEGSEYVDLCTSFGSALLGHAHRRVSQAVGQALDVGLICAHEHEWHARLAQRIAEAVPAVEMLRFTMSGTETTYYAVKLAREYTGRPLVVKFEGHFHGYNDYLAYNYWPAPDKAWPQVTPAAAGTPEDWQKCCIVLPFNDFERAEETLVRRGPEIAAVILEPVNYNSGTLLPGEGFLQLLRRLTAEQGSLLIFDEILSGFRTGPGCMQATYGVIPDLCTLGKALGGGMPLSAFGGKRSIMEHVSPLGRVQHSGTYNGHLAAIAGGLAFFDVIGQAGCYEALLARCRRLYAGIDEIAGRLGFPARVQVLGARFSLLFGPPAGRTLRQYRDVVDNDWPLFHRFCTACLEHGVYLHTMWHHGISTAHTDADIDRALEGIEAAFRDVLPESSE